MHQLLGHELTWDSDYRYKLLLHRAECHLGIEVKRKTPITPHLLVDIAYLFDRENPLQAAMWALFLVVFYSFLRKSNLVVDSETPRFCCIRTFISRGRLLMSPFGRARLSCFKRALFLCLCHAFQVVYCVLSQF